jgi:hypothetical protein
MPFVRRGSRSKPARAEFPPGVLHWVVFCNESIKQTGCHLRRPAEERTMTILFGRRRVNIEISVTSVGRRHWADLQAAELVDHSLARFNQRNGARDEDAHWRGLKWVQTGCRHI